MLLFTLSTPPSELAVLQSLYARFRNDMFHEARRFLPSDADAEDVVHDVFLTLIGSRAVKRAQSDETGVRRFLLICARNRAIGLAEHMRYTVLTPPPEAPKDRPDTDELISERLDRRALLRRLGAAMEKLNPIYSDALYLRIGGRSISEIAELFGEKPETIKKRLHRARQLLHKLSDEE